eukprot:gnl/TRDRNA2_/TRDRNA2_74334_c0_seq1.p1 gnl/TRDRNA2_/TRDRNA2_74334_c0~~gnl/TRDRNA2_/TRDRNA2_74334_c0_seq1.p1  ORF type:complete len:519 (+),score=67.50 gnl/TRDRNA2_/TRDRNA2_74334_c0_seq1:49-1557(+)
MSVQELNVILGLAPAIIAGATATGRSSEQPLLAGSVAVPAAGATALVPLLSLCVALRLPHRLWPCRPEHLLRHLDRCLAESLSTAALLDIYRCNAAVAFLQPTCGERSDSINGSFDNHCPRLAHVMRQRLAGILGDAAGKVASEHDPRLKEHRVAILAKFGALGECLQRERPGTVVGEEAGLLVKAGRTLRTEVSKTGWAPPSSSAAVAVLEWCAAAAVPAPAVDRNACCVVAQRTEMLGGVLLRRSLIAALDGAWQPTRRSKRHWRLLLRALLKELPQKWNLISADGLLQVVTAALWLVRALAPFKAWLPVSARILMRRAPKAATTPTLRRNALALRQLVRRGLHSILEYLAKRPGLLVQVSQPVLVDALVAMRICYPISEAAGRYPSLLLPDSTPYVPELCSPEPAMAAASPLLKLVPERSRCFIARRTCSHTGICHHIRGSMLQQAVFRGVSEVPLSSSEAAVTQVIRHGLLLQTGRAFAARRRHEGGRRRRISTSKKL